MSTPKQSQRFAEVEYCLQNYFNSHIAGVMHHEQQELNKKQVKEYSDYTTSTVGILRSAANSMNNMPDDSMQYVKLTGKWNSKTAEDYVEMCQKKITGSKDFQKDLGRMAGEWRNTVVAEIGRERYDRISQKLGGDLAFAYVDYRVEQMMLDRMVAERMPESSMDYILRKGTAGSLLGLLQSLSQSPLEKEIERKGEAAYRPSTLEKGVGKAVSFGTDVVMTGGFSSWASVGKMAGVEVVFAGMENYLEKKQGAKSMTIEECISRGVFGSSRNVLGDFRKQSGDIRPWENNYVQSFNKQLSKKMSILTERPFWMSDNHTLWQQPEKELFSGLQRKTEYANIPIIVASGHEQEYLDEQKKRWEAKKEETQPALTANPDSHTDKENPLQPTGKETNKASMNDRGWGDFISSIGMNGITDIGKNLGYVIAMLPDMLIGLFTGKTQSLNLKNSLVPAASILLGMFVKNPLLKMTLIGMGGLNLINKTGHEAMEKQERHSDRSNAGAQYKHYADEPLNPRIGNPALQGNFLIATIDKVPCSIQLPSSVVAAYETGTLPLNTLSNAVLTKNDRMRHVAQENYRAAENNQSEDRERTVVIK